MSKPVDINETDLSYLNEGKTFVQVWSEKCQWCDKQKPVSEKVLGDIEGVKFASINLNYFDDKPSNFRRLYMEGAMKAPVLLVFQDGGLIGRTYKALLSESLLKKFIEEPTIENLPPPKPITLNDMKAQAFDLLRNKERLELQLRQLLDEIAKVERV